MESRVTCSGNCESTKELHRSRKRISVMQSETGERDWGASRGRGEAGNTSILTLAACGLGTSTSSSLHLPSITCEHDNNLNNVKICTARMPFFYLEMC